MVEFVNKPGIMGQDDMGRTIASAVKTVAEDRLAPARVKQLELMMQRGAFEEAEKQKKRIAQKLAFGPDPMLGDYNPGRDVKGNVYDKRGAPLRMLANKEDFYDMVKEHQKQARKAVAKIGAPLGMAAAAGEAVATVMGALEMTGKNTKAVKAIADDIENRFTKLMIDGAITALVDPSKDVKGSFKDMPKAERQKKIKEKIKIDKMHKDLGDSINEILGKYNSVKENIVYIATTGYSKFPEGSRGIANKLIEFDPKTGTLTHDIDTGGPNNISKSIKNMSKATKFYCAFKTSKKNPYSTLRTATGKFEYHQPLPNRTLNELMIDTLLDDLDLYGLDESYKYMTEDLVIENLFKKAIDKVKTIGGSIKDYLSGFFNKIVEGFKKAIAGIIKLGKKAFEALLNFLGLEITDAKIRISGVGGIFAS